MSERTIVILLLLVQGALLCWSAVVHSPTIDEPAHLAAGLQIWNHGRVDIYSVNPPLVRMIAALPAAFDGALLCDAPRPIEPGERLEWRLGSEGFRANGPRSRWHLIWGRWCCIPLVLIGGWVCQQWAADLYGSTAGCTTLALWCFCPNLLGHGSLLTSDAAAANVGVLAMYCYWRWWRDDLWLFIWISGFALGVALLTKLTWVVLPLIWAGFATVRPSAARFEHEKEWEQRRKTAREFAIIFSIGLLVLNIGYGGSGCLQPLGRFEFVSDILSGSNNVAALQESKDTAKFRFQSGNRFAKSWVGSIAVPVPQDYLIGLDLQRFDFESNASPCYLRGEFRKGGWWYWYLYAFVVKVPLGTLALIGLAANTKHGSSPHSNRRADQLCLLVPAVSVIALASSQTGSANHFRYVLPAFPFILIWASQAVADSRTWRRNLAMTCVTLSALSSLACYPHNLSYFNELVGGPQQGGKQLLDSNLDWGQDLFFLKAWCDLHPEARPLFTEYFGSQRPEDIGISSRHSTPGPVLRDGRWDVSRVQETDWPQPGYHAISINQLHSEHGEFALFQSMTPFDRAGYSINIYHVTAEVAMRARHERGLPAIPYEPSRARP